MDCSRTDSMPQGIGLGKADSIKYLEGIDD